MTPSMKQQTLTQIEFVSSFNDEEDEDVVQLSDASGDEYNNSKQNEGDKENRVPLRKQLPTKSKRADGHRGDGEEEDEARVPDTEDEGEDDDDGPTVRRRKRQVAFADAGKTKRRRTLGDEHRRNTMNEQRTTRRRTLGDSPAASKSRYHTQTLTQLIGRGSLIADSDDDEGLGDGQNDDGFLDWLGYNQEAEPPSPTAAVRAAAPATSPTKTKEKQLPQYREESIIPQTPVKSIRFQLPPSPQAASPSPAKVSKYGAPDRYTSPSKKSTHGSEAALSAFPGKPQPRSPVAPQRAPSLVIQDSYASDGWASLGGTQPRCTPSQTQSQMYSTPAEAPANAKKSEPEPVQSQDAQTEADVYHEATSQPQADVPSQREGDAVTTPKQTQRPDESRRQEIPDSDDEEGEFDDESQEHIDEALFAAGAETQLIMDQLQSSVQKWTRPQHAPLPSSSIPSPRPLHTSSSVPGSEATPQSAPPSSAKPLPPSSSICHDIPTTPTPNGAAIRKPLHHPADPTDTQGLPLESQRVPVAVLQAFPPATARSDILLPISTATSNNLVFGLQDTITLPFKIPAQVVRFWLLTGTLLRYLCSTDEAAYQLPDGNWSYPITQVYELNNPVHEEDMRAEEWIHGQVSRYSYLPPAVVSQLLWNLRHALFDEEETNDTKILSTPPEKMMPNSSQMHSSSPLPVQPQYKRPPPPSTMPAPPPPDRAAARGIRSNTVQPHVRPSQATTASQASISTPPRSTQRSRREQDKDLGATMPSATPAAAPVVGQHNSSSDSLVFDDHGGSSISMPYAVPGLDDDSSLASQLLTKSQMLPESLVEDEVRFPNEIGDSDDE